MQTSAAANIMIRVMIPVHFELEVKRSRYFRVNQAKKSDITIAVITSFGVWHPRYIRENPIRRNVSTKIHFQYHFSALMASVAKRLVPLCVCPLGKEYPVAAGMALSTALNSGSSTQGRGIRNVIFRLCTRSPAHK